jgi:hypothetical protein
MEAGRFAGRFRGEEGFNGTEAPPKSPYEVYVARNLPANICSLANTHNRMGSYQLALPLYEESPWTLKSF